MKKKILLLDVMNTLVRDPFERELPRAFGYSKQDFLRNKRPGLWPKFERAEISEKEFLERCLREPSSPPAETVHQALRAGYRWLPGIESLLNKLSDNQVPMYALSNYPIWYQIVENKLGCSRFFSWDFVSWNTGVRKPDQSAYVNPLESLDIPVSCCYFVDDRLENCSMASRLGIHTHHFQTVGRFRDFLRLNGLLR